MAITPYDTKRHPVFDVQTCSFHKSFSTEMMDKADPVGEGQCRNVQ